MFKSHTYKIASAFIVPLVYGDYSGLSDTEVDQVKSFIKSLPIGHFANWSQNSEFSHDEISGMMADCLTVKYLARG